MPAAHDHEGSLIVFEGIDGAGTTTQAQRYTERLSAAGRLAHLTCEPSGGPIGSLLRLGLTGRMSLGGARQAATMALLFAADRLDHLAMEIEPQLREGAVVLCDRYYLSSIAYQTASRDEPAGGEPERAFVGWVCQLNDRALRPDATVVLHVPADEAARRRDARHTAPELYEHEALQRRLAAFYERASELVPDERILHVDGTGPVEQVTARVHEALDPLLALS